MGLKSPERWWRVGLALVFVIALPPAIAALLWSADVTLTPWPLAGVAAGVVVWLSRDRETRAATLTTVVAIVAAAFCIALLVWDVTYDGQTYQQAALRALAAGWNPVWSPDPPPGTTGAVYVSALPKAAWTWWGMAYQLTTAPEAGKALQWLAICAAFVLARGALLSAGAESRSALVISSLAAGNPVALTQLVSFHLDGLVASSLVIVAALLVRLVQAPDRATAFACVVATAFLVNLKFPAAVYAALLVAGAITMVALRRPDSLRRLVAPCVLAAALATLQGINPYVTNTVRHGHPAWPARGTNAMQLVVHFDTVFSGQPRLVQYARGLFARTNDRDEEPPQVKLPLTIRASELRSLGTVDTRIGGLGPLFGGTLLLALALSVGAVARRRSNAALLGVLTLGVLLSGLAIPFGYYSRYAPQVWLAALPVLLTDGLRGWGTRAVAGLLAANALLVASISLGTQLFLGVLQREQVREIVAVAGGGRVTWIPGDRPFTNVDLRIAAYGGEPARVSDLRCPAPATLVTTHARVCIGDDRSPPAAPDPEQRAAWILDRVRR